MDMFGPNEPVSAYRAFMEAGIDPATREFYSADALVRVHMVSDTEGLTPARAK
jgi:hypothetical protein